MIVYNCTTGRYEDVDLDDGSLRAEGLRRAVESKERRYFSYSPVRSSSQEICTSDVDSENANGTPAPTPTTSTVVR